MNCINGGFGIYTNSVPAVIADLPQNAFTYAWWEEFSGNSTAFRLPTQWYWGIVDFGASITAGYDNENNKDQLLVYNHPSSGWHHMVYVFDYRNKSHSIYLDGKLNNTANNLNHSYGTINGIRIGLYDLGCEDSSAASTFDDIHLYNRALSAAEIQALYNATK
jgi:hypothetical protein